jgi:hypothetical protein
MLSVDGQEIHTTIYIVVVPTALGVIIRLRPGPGLVMN